MYSYIRRMDTLETPPRKMVEVEGWNLMGTYESYTSEQLIKRIREVEASTKQTGLVDIVFKLEDTSGSYDSTPSYNVCAYGKRLETDKEYTKRVAAEAENDERQRKNRERSYLTQKKEFDPQNFTKEDAARLKAL